MTDMNNVLLAGNNAFCVGDRAFEWGVDVGSIESIRCDGISWFAVIKLDAPDRYGRRRFPLTVGDLCHPQFRPMDKVTIYVDPKRPSSTYKSFKIGDSAWYGFGSQACKGTIVKIDVAKDSVRVRTFAGEMGVGIELFKLMQA